MPSGRNARQHKNPPRTKKLLILALGALLIIGGLLISELTGLTHFIRHRNTGLVTVPVTPRRTAGPNTKGVPAASATGTPSSPSPDSGKQQSGGTNAELIAPSGNFVSNHHPDLSGTPNPNQMQSVCVTSSGATCTIVFTKGSITKQLPPQATDLEGAAYWSWKLQDIGLTAGTWKIQAQAQMNGRQKTADDALTLEVGP